MRRHHLSEQDREWFRIYCSDMICVQCRKEPMRHQTEPETSYNTEDLLRTDEPSEDWDSKNWPVTSSEQPSRDPQPGRAGSGGWCVGGPCSQHGRTFSGPAGCDGAEGDSMPTLLILSQHFSWWQLYNEPKPYKIILCWGHFTLFLDGSPTPSR